MSSIINEVLNTTSGWLSKKEAELLYTIAYKKAGNIVEIGSYKGRSTVILAWAIMDADKTLIAQGKVYAIDPQFFTKDFSSKALKENIVKHGIEKYVNIIIKTSEEAHKGWTDSIDFLWIDGDHAEEMAEKDFLLWEPHLKIGGVIAFHDATFNFPGVRKVVGRYIFKSKRFKNVGFVDNIVFGIKCENNTMNDRIANLYNFFLKNLVTLTAFIKLPRFIKEFAKPVVRFMAKSKY